MKGGGEVVVVVIPIDLINPYSLHPFHPSYDYIFSATLSASYYVCELLSVCVCVLYIYIYLSSASGCPLLVVGACVCRID